VALTHPGLGPLAHGPAQIPVVQQAAQGGPEGRIVEGRREKPGLVAAHHLGHPAVVEGHHRQSHGLGLQVDHAQGLPDTRKGEQIGGA